LLAPLPWIVLVKSRTTTPETRRTIYEFLTRRTELDISNCLGEPWRDLGLFNEISSHIPILGLLLLSKSSPVIQSPPLFSPKLPQPSTHLPNPQANNTPPRKPSSWAEKHTRHLPQSARHSSYPIFYLTLVSHDYMKAERRILAKEAVSLGSTRWNIWRKCNVLSVP
jgi:hypothetical protein